jgi:hypothetical protein
MYLREIYAAFAALKDSPDPVDVATCQDLMAARTDLLVYGAGDPVVRLRVAALRRRLARRGLGAVSRV